MAANLADALRLAREHQVADRHAVGRAFRCAEVLGSPPGVTALPIVRVGVVQQQLGGIEHVLAASGGRIDHALENLMLLARWAGRGSL